MGTYRTTHDDLEYLFEKYKVCDIYIPKDKHTKESRGFGFVRFRDKRNAEDAMDALGGRMYDGRDLRIQIAKYGRPENDIGGPKCGRRDRIRSRSGGRRRRLRTRSRSRSRDRRRDRSRSGRREKVGLKKQGQVKVTR